MEHTKIAFWCFEILDLPDVFQCFVRPSSAFVQPLKFFKRDCQNLKLLPKGGYGEPTDGGFNQIKVTGQVQTPWFGGEVGMNVAWRFLLDENNKIYFVAIDLLASPAELLKLGKS